MLRAFAGSPTHIDIGVGQTVYSVSPTLCRQYKLPIYATLPIVEQTLVRLVSFVTPNVDAVEYAAEIYAVGPMTRLGSWHRYRTGRLAPLDVDCVTAAYCVLKAAGVDLPPPRTPKELLAWLESSSLPTKPRR